MNKNNRNIDFMGMLKHLHVGAEVFSAIEFKQMLNNNFYLLNTQVYLDKPVIHCLGDVQLCGDGKAQMCLGQSGQFQEMFHTMGDRDPGKRHDAMRLH